jgi:hypothetical protein
MHTQVSMVIHAKSPPKFSNFLCRLKCLFGMHQMLPMGEVRMYGQRSFVIECPHCTLSRWGSWSHRFDFGSCVDWEMRGGRVRKSVIGREIKSKRESDEHRAVKKFRGKAGKDTGGTGELSQDYKSL